MEESGKVSGGQYKAVVLNLTERQVTWALPPEISNQQVWGRAWDSVFHQLSGGAMLLVLGLHLSCEAKGWVVSSSGRTVGTPPLCISGLFLPQVLHWGAPLLRLASAMRFHPVTEQWAASALYSERGNSYFAAMALLLWLLFLKIFVFEHELCLSTLHLSPSHLHSTSTLILAAMKLLRFPFEITLKRNNPTNYNYWYLSK